MPPLPLSVHPVVVKLTANIEMSAVRFGWTGVPALENTAELPEPGAPPPVQLAPVLKSVAELAHVICETWAIADTAPIAASARVTQRRRWLWLARPRGREKVRELSVDKSGSAGGMNRMGELN